MIVAALPWSQSAAIALAPALGDATQEIRAEVISGSCQLWAIKDYGLIITRLETNTDPAVLVLVAAAGRGLVEVVAAFQKLAQAKKYNMRIHTRRPAIGRLLCRKFEFKTAGVGVDGFTIYKWSGNNGRKV